jgi:hypothetical protein
MPVWHDIHITFVAHVQHHHLDLTPYNLSSLLTANQYARSPFQLLTGGYRLADGQRLNVTHFSGYDITLNTLGQVTSRV